MKILTPLLIALALAGCEDRFRYPCMDSRNWDKDDCKRPACTVTQTCPDMLMKPEDMKGEVR